MSEDAQLLIRYGREREESAFAELVRRHVDLVYSVALRRVAGDHHRALEVAQAVFIAMARNAQRLSRHPALAAWLHVSTRNAAANLLRAERRRERHLQHAQAMPDFNAAESAGDWDQVRPVLDETLDQLSERERTAILLRFFENHSYAEIGAALSLQEDAARKQVNRTLEKLQQLLTRRGVRSSVAALATVMTEHAVIAAPAGVAASITSGALAGAAAASGAGSLVSLLNAGAFKVGIAGVLIAGVAAVLVYENTNPAAAAIATAAPGNAEPAKPAAPIQPVAEIPKAPTVSEADAALAEALTYDLGKTVKRDAAKARAAYERAGRLGSAAAEFRLGYFYEVGDGVPQSYPQARVHYERAVALGLPSAHLRLGILDLEGWGATRDVASAVRQITAAADAGDRSAQRVLSGMYFAGIGVNKDFHQALALEERAAREDDPEAETAVGLALGLLNRENANLAREWYQLSAEQDYAEGILAMASTFLRPGATMAQAEDGRKWLQLSAERGNGPAAFYLAGLLLHPPNRAPNPSATAEAKGWLEKSRDRGEPAAAEVLELSESMPLAQAFEQVMTIPPERRYVTREAARLANARPDASGFLQPVPTKIVQPVYPVSLRLTRMEGEAVVDFHVDSTGRVRQAKVARATHPAFGEAAVLAVSGWRFTPGLRNGHAVNCHLQVPMKFNASMLALGAAAMSCELRSINRVAGQNPGVAITLAILSPGPIRPRAGRVIVTKARDDRGAELTLPSVPDLFPTAVGMTSDAELTGPTPRDLSFTIGKPTDGAKRLQVVEGHVELILPDNDPDSTVTVDAILSKLAARIEAPTFAEAGITVVVYDKATCDRYRDAKVGAGGPQDYDAGLLFGSRREDSLYAKLPPEVAARMMQNFTMKDNQLALGISDPEGHLVGLEFRTKDGQPLRYNHNGSYHSSGMPGKPDRRFDTYELPAPLPPNIQMVCWVATKQATVTVPFHFEEVALPFYGETRR